MWKLKLAAYSCCIPHWIKIILLGYYWEIWARIYVTIVEHLEWWVTKTTENHFIKRNRVTFWAHINHSKKAVVYFWKIACFRKLDLLKELLCILVIPRATKLSDIIVSGLKKNVPCNEYGNWRAVTYITKLASNPKCQISKFDTWLLCSPLACKDKQYLIWKIYIFF